MEKIIYTARKRTICGTDWPITFRIYKIGSTWCAVELCNGTSLGSTTERTKAKAELWCEKREFAAAFGV